ncbi:multidrug effflux MFS transporter [Bdellovibrio sp. HCB274]|uniref:multidrug effflux MFS transporter n=1 Tax=Bdellovibrio sp. HCB274 TaxID=3394361 RepID=UPI0039B4C909
MSEKTFNKTSLILVLGSLTALGPFSIDMYLPAFPKMAEGLGTTVPQVTMSLSSYFVGLAAGQLFYGPFLDRFGRKLPLYVGLIIYILASIGCAFSKSVETLIFFRFVQAIGGCASGVTAMAMVRDYFTPKESAKVLSLLILILGLSPLLAPTVGGLLATHLGWQSLFWALTGLGAFVLSLAFFFLPSAYIPNKEHSLHPIMIVKNYWEILKNPRFYAYALAGAIGFSGMFAYLAASPTIFMEIFKVSEQTYGIIFAVLASGLIGASQVNVLLLKRLKNETILRGGLIGMLTMGAIFFLGTSYGVFGLYSTLVVLFLYLSCVGFSNPNAAALALAPFAKNAGSAAAMIGFLQMALGAIASVLIGLIKSQDILPIAAVFLGTSTVALVVLIMGTKRIAKLST